MMIYRPLGIYRRHRRDGCVRSSTTMMMIIMVATTVLFAIVPLLLHSSYCSYCCYGIEIIAKENEWTLIHENDTVDAGMHIRIDLSTGEKWVKQISNDDNEDDVTTTTTTTGMNDQNFHTNTAIIAIDQQQYQNDEVNKEEMIIDTKGEMTSSSSSNHHEIHHHQPQYDYEMMYRTLSRLPSEEQERIQLPKYYIMDNTKNDDSGNNTTTTSTKLEKSTERIQFEIQMKQIWEQRQEELRQLELADLPTLLKERIIAIQNYIRDPIEHIIQLISTKSGSNKYPTTISSETTSDLNHNDNMKDDNDNDTKHQSIETIIDVLQDLEYQLQDLDMTRDFHTLGGWDILVSLLDDTIHTSNNNTSIVSYISSHHNHSSSNPSTDSYIDHIQEQHVAYYIHTIQMYTAWVMGTAVKHIEEFHPYAVEIIPVHNQNMKITPIDLIVQQIQSSMTEYTSIVITNTTNIIRDDENNGASNQRTYRTMLETKLLRLLYCLGSLLRGNYIAQSYFHTICHESKKNILSNVLLQGTHVALYNDISSSKTISDQTFMLKFIVRIINLISDCMVDVTSAISSSSTTNNNNNHQEQLSLILQNWTAIWCPMISNQSIYFQNATLSNTIANNIRSGIDIILSHCPLSTNSTSNSIVTE